MQLVLEKLILHNFRNLKYLNISFNRNINCIFGKNGNGKTNILEAVHLILNKKSFRKNCGFPQLLNYDADETFFIIQSLFSNNDTKLTFSLQQDSNRAVITINGSVTNRKIELPTLFVSPFDAYEFFNTPKRRREWFNEHQSKLDKEYKSQLKRYNQILKFKNSLLLKKPNNFKKQIIALHREMSDLIVYLYHKRISFLQELKQYYFDTFKAIFDEDFEIDTRLDTNIPIENVDNFLEENLEKEIIVGKTLYGSHKDNFLIYFNGLNAIDYCSIGQQKMTYFSLIFAYIELFRYKHKSFPLILMDDISGELDNVRWEKFISFLDKLKIQVLITTANTKFKEELEKRQSVKIFNVIDGTLDNSKE
jgi:DNA replication and repair protein RecF